MSGAPLFALSVQKARSSSNHNHFWCHFHFSKCWRIAGTKSRFQLLKFASQKRLDSLLKWMLFWSFSTFGQRFGFVLPRGSHGDFRKRNLHLVSRNITDFEFSKTQKIFREIDKWSWFFSTSSQGTKYHFWLFCAGPAPGRPILVAVSYTHLTLPTKA